MARRKPARKPRSASAKRTKTPTRSRTRARSKGRARTPKRKAPLKRKAPPNRRKKETPTLPPYRDLSDYIRAYQNWDGEYDYIEVETSADY